MIKHSIAVAAIAGLALSASAANARDQIRIVGSSTVFPFSTAVAEQFGKTSDFKTPVVESTGSGGGMKLFCAGVGVAHPDITNASRRIKVLGIRRSARKNRRSAASPKSRSDFDGIVLANSKAKAKQLCPDQAADL